MYLIKTYLDKSPIDGIGLFAGEDVPKGTLIWKFIPRFDQEWTPEEFEKLPDIAKTYLRKHGFFMGGKYFMGGDHDQFANHSDCPNIGPGNGLGDDYFALNDIKKGDEITCDYSECNELIGNVPGFENRKYRPVPKQASPLRRARC